jgi:hypothetical protein
MDFLGKKTRWKWKSKCVNENGKACHTQQDNVRCKLSNKRKFLHKHMQNEYSENEKLHKREQEGHLW